MALAERLPDFPWDTLADARQAAEAHPDGIVDLSVGTPVDPTPRLAIDALAAAGDSPGYPTVWGDPATRAAIRAVPDGVSMTSISASPTPCSTWTDGGSVTGMGPPGGGVVVQTCTATSSQDRAGVARLSTARRRQCR